MLRILTFLKKMFCTFFGVTLGLITTFGGDPSLFSQTSGHPVVEASALARSTWQEVRSAANQGDMDRAAAAIKIATTAWPTQVVYQRARALIAAYSEDVAVLAEAIDVLTLLESGGNLVDDDAVAVMRSNPEIESAILRLIEANSPIRQSTAWRTIPDSTFYAEGIDAAANGSIFVTSIRHRTVIEINPGGGIRDLDLSRHNRMGGIFGVRVDPGQQFLWITTNGLGRTQGYLASDEGISALLRVRISDGAIDARWDLQDEENGHILGDLAIGPSGDVLVTDSDTPQLLRLRRGQDSFEHITHPLFRSLQGVVIPPGERVAFVADYSHGLLRVDLETKEVIRLPDPAGKTSLGLDGIVWYRGSIVAIQSGVNPPRISLFELDATGSAITVSTTIDRNVPLADEPTIGTLIDDDFIYVGNSQWEKYDDQGNRRPGTVLAPTTILRLPLSGR